MEHPLSSVVWWLVPLWSAGLIAYLAIRLWTRGREKRGAMILTVLAVIAAIPLIPALAAQRVHEPPTQVVYRFGDHRWLELKGWMCEGALTYVDAKQGIRTEAAPQFYRIVFFPYIHPSERYIAIPLDDLSGILISRDGGRTFESAFGQIAIGFRNRYGEERPHPEDVKQFVVVDDRGYIETKNGRVLQSSLPIGDYWGLAYIDYPWAPSDETMTLYDQPGFQDMKSKAPEVKGYTGWTHMKCDPNVGIVPPKTSLAGVPGLIYSVEAYSIGAPVFWGWRAYKHLHKPASDVNG
ncbi:T6SS immunity protein Tli3 family protein [Paraburkholderia caballeronis]|uniref:Tli3-like domain-containing protein n=1 Tax=Paraburkholderia caballeronis TaxID=416943 RepID=A0A1H7RIR3_9BURK|nr:hypothetical protein [Paraburkholderia caballeronis]PXW23053.1 hypothetical protein C7403_11135 [Paraburkholderia caballeronis]PXW97717.1 hypothetical protein C7407_11135 [Paraburkholderia caballeronis]RAJ94687.1 hypothetical protein C7409_11135 [Paraburkholderia caballeronis]SEE82343.1 hypothetical protein SAMN05445871_6300 [Paraburkholderia caballeronis]SEL60062.1 hypothetical protein SAMN05192542_11035 [Paraburkholderia caballeronis]